MAWFNSWDVLARAEMTLRLGHGQRRLATRVLLADGRVLEQINPGLPDLENDWHEIDRFSQLDNAVDQLAHEGWSVERTSSRSPHALLDSSARPSAAGEAVSPPRLELVSVGTAPASGEV